MKIAVGLGTMLFLLITIHASMAARGAEPSAPTVEYELEGQTYVVMPTWKLFREADPRAEHSTGWSKTFLAQLAGPRWSKELGGASTSGAPWVLLGCLPFQEPRRGYMIAFERKLTRAWVNMLPMSDTFSGGRSVVKDRELLHIQLVDWGRQGTVQSAFESFQRGHLPSMVCSPKRNGKPTPLGSIYFNADRSALTSHHNVNISAQPNFSAVTRSSDFGEIPSAPPLPVVAVAAIVKYIEQPFPNDEQVIHTEKGCLIDRFEMNEPTKINQPSVVNLSFRVRALHVAEKIRLGASNGGFQRIGQDILYRPDAPGEHTLTLEAMCGFHHDGKVDFAERREIKVKVEEDDE